LRDHPARGELILDLWQALGGAAADMKLEALALARLTAYAWPGNLRQLIGALRALMALGTPGQPIGVDDLPIEVREARSPPPMPPSSHRDRDVANLDALERQAMQAALDACAGNVSAAARRLGVSRSTLYRRLGISPGTN